jgi:hypothetical protein
LIDQRALPRTRRTGQADDTSFAGVWEHGFEQIGPSGGTILNTRNSAGERAGVAGTYG